MTKGLHRPTRTAQAVRKRQPQLSQAMDAQLPHAMHEGRKPVHTNAYACPPLAHANWQVLPMCDSKRGAGASDKQKVSASGPADWRATWCRTPVSHALMCHDSCSNRAQTDTRACMPRPRLHSRQTVNRRINGLHIGRATCDMHTTDFKLHEVTIPYTPYAMHRSSAKGLQCRTTHTSQTGSRTRPNAIPSDCGNSKQGQGFISSQLASFISRLLRCLLVQRIHARN